MPGETDLKKLLRSMEPLLHEEEYVYCSVPPGTPLPEAAEIRCSFREAEGVTLILRRESAESAELPFHYACRMITLQVHSALDAVGFLAAIAGLLTERGISCNVVSAYHHDHLFVPAERAGEAFQALRALSGG